MSRRRIPYGGRDDTDLVMVLDCADLDRAAAFWCAALGYVDPTKATGTYRSLYPANASGIELLLQRVPEDKRAKSRMHLDLRTKDLDGEVARLLALGARRVTAEPIEEAGWTWHILLDPDDNEFCVLRPPAAHWDG